VAIRRSLALVLAIVLVCPPLAAGADDAAARARAHNKNAKQLFSLGLFEQAAAEYMRAYRTRPLPVFLFNLAQCHKRMVVREHLERAIFYFRSYLANEPATPMRAEIEAEIAKLRRQLAAFAATMPAATQPTERPRPIYKRWWFWTLIGAAVAGAAVGAGVAASKASMEPVAGKLYTVDLRQ
jgi:hypothetical protein